MCKTNPWFFRSLLSLIRLNIVSYHFHVVSSGFKSLFSELWGQYRDLEVNRIKW